MAARSAFHDELQAAVDERHQADHPLIAKWAAGEIGRETVAGAIAEIWYWINGIQPKLFFHVSSGAPDDVIEMQLENYREETDPENPHMALILRFAAACGLSRETLDRGRGLPTTESLVGFQLATARRESWIAGVAASAIASEAQEPALIGKVLPALRGTYGFSEHELEFWWLHGEADIEHGGRAFRVLERHCVTRADKDLAIHWAREGARMKWLFWDGIALHYETGYRLQ